MPNFVALLRGINVGKFKRVPMADLRDLLGGLGYKSVQTLLNSGNAVFNARGGSEKAHAKAIADAIADRLSIEVPVIVKSQKSFDTIVRSNTIAVDSDMRSQFLVAFAPDEIVLSNLDFIEPLIAPKERFLVCKHAVYLYCARGILESKAADALLGKLGKSVTTRNWATTLKLHALIHGSV